MGALRVRGPLSTAHKLPPALPLPLSFFTWLAAAIRRSWSMRRSRRTRTKPSRSTAPRSRCGCFRHHPHAPSAGSLTPHMYTTSDSPACPRPPIRPSAHGGVLAVLRLPLLLHRSLEAKELRNLRVSLSSFMDMLLLTCQTIDRFSQYKVGETPIEGLEVMPVDK